LIARLSCCSLRQSPDQLLGAQLPSLAPGSAGTVRGRSSWNRFEKKRGLQVERRRATQPKR
jgi:hypothetical protein